MEYARYLLSSFPLSELEQRDALGLTWLHATVIRDELEVCKLLIERGYDTTIKNSLGETALEMAIRLKKPDFVRLMVHRSEG